MRPLLIDVREPQEYNLSHADGAINIPISHLPDNSYLMALPRHQRIIVYCRSGARSAHAVHMLQQLGFTEAVNATDASMAEELARS